MQTLTPSHPVACKHRVSHPPMKCVKGDRCMKGVKCGKCIINVTGGAIGCEMHEQQKDEKAYNTCIKK